MKLLRSSARGCCVLMFVAGCSGNTSSTLAPHPSGAPAGDGSDAGSGADAGHASTADASGPGSSSTTASDASAVDANGSSAVSTPVSDASGASVTEGGGADGGTAASCDRTCLKGMITAYLTALVAHDPSPLPVSSKVKFTEDTKAIALGQGLWKTASGFGTYRMDILDVAQGGAGAFVIVDEGTSPDLLVLRLKVVDKLITEVETQITRNSSEGGGIFDPAALKTPSAALTMVPSASQLDARSDVVATAELYPAGLKVGSFANIPFSSDAYRFENGMLTAGPGCTFMSGCTNIKTETIPTLTGITYRLGPVDEQLGIALIRQDFGAGSTFSSGTSLIVWEAFKVYGKQLHAVEAFMKTMPVNTPSGW